ncbi:MAG: RNA polymerase sigma factor [Planctomycetes bacterium]|nr:RNA polymerase sigma factor [Planctomycetota bacterium]
MDLRDPEAFRATYENNAKKLYNLALRLVGDRHRAEEIMQDTFLRAFDRAETFREGARVSTWLYRICANLSYDYLRAKRYRDAVSLETRVATDEGSSAELADRLPAPVEDPGEEAGQEEVRAAVRGILDALPERERTVLILRHYEGMTYERIGEALGLTSRTVQNCLRRARTKMFFELRKRGITARELP